MKPSALLAVTALLLAPGAAAFAQPQAEPAAVQFKGLNLKVANLARSRAFYEAVIGMKLARVISDGSSGPPQVLLTGDGAFDIRTSTLLALKQLPARELAPRRARARYGLINFLVADLESTVARAAAAGYRFERFPNGIVVVDDPDGNQVELIQTPR